MISNIAPNLLTYDYAETLIKSGGILMERIPDTISVSSFNRGHAGEIFESVKVSDNPLVVVKNNEPIAVVVSVELYNYLVSHTFESRIGNRKTKQSGAGSLSKYAREEYADANVHDLYRDALNSKHGK